MKAKDNKATLREIKVLEPSITMICNRINRHKIRANNHSRISNVKAIHLNQRVHNQWQILQILSTILTWISCLANKKLLKLSQKTL